MRTIAFSRVLGLALFVFAASLGAQTGTLTVYKTFEPASLAATMAAPASFPVQITCTPGVTTTVGLNSGNQFQVQTSPMPAGAVCTIIELTPQNVALRPGCRWALVAYPKEQSVTIPNGTASLVVQNGINCEDKPPAPNVSLRKTGGGAVTVGATATFYLSPANVGPGSVGVNGATVVDTVPAMFGSVTATGAPDWGCSVSGLVVTCVYTGSVGPNQSMAQIIVTARAEREGNRANCATITPTPGPDAQPGDNRSCVGVTVTDAVVPAPVQSLTVRKILVPAGDLGKFVLRIDNINRAFGVGHNGSTGAISLTAGSHTVTEGGYPGTSLANYTATFGGDCTASGTVALTPGSNKTCTITNTRKPSTGTWSQGPGSYVLTVCAFPATCTITGVGGQQIAIKLEVWSGGGGGGAGGPAGSNNSAPTGGSGGGGGGSGGYSTRPYTATIPTTGTIGLHVRVGAGGAGGVLAGGFAQHQGQSGELSEIRTGSALGAVVIHASGGAGGRDGGFANTGYPGTGGVAGAGSEHNPGTWVVGRTGVTGAVVQGCNGGAGGPGGDGGGPGNINNGGGGGHGGYYRKLALPTCTAKGHNFGLTPGAAGAGGRVTLTW